MGWRGTDVLAAVRLRVQPADQARLQGDVAVFAVFSNQASVELTQGDHDAVWVVVRIRLLPGFISVFEYPYAVILEDDLVLVGVGLRGIGHDLLPFVLFLTIAVCSGAAIFVDQTL